MLPGSGTAAGGGCAPAPAQRSPLRLGMEHELECAICRGVLIDPRVLSCQHTFCLRCLYISAGRKQTTRLTLTCAFCAEAGTTETAGDIRSLRRNPIISNLSQALRRQRFEHAVNQEGRLQCESGEVISCDGCGAERGLQLCPRCSMTLCPDCSSDADHQFLCVEAEGGAREQQEGYPFFVGWVAAEEALQAKLRISHGVRGAVVREMRRISAPFSVEQVTGAVTHGATLTEHEDTVPVYTSNALGEFRQKVEADGVVPAADVELSLLSRLHDLKSRQMDILLSLEALLQSRELCSHLSTHSGRVRDPIAWDCGLASDVCFHSDLLLAVYRLMCVPLDRKLTLFSVLVGLGQLEVRAEEQRGATTQHQLDFFRRQLRRHVDMSCGLQLRIDEATAKEDRLAGALAQRVAQLQGEQHRAWFRWRLDAAVHEVRLQSLKVSGSAIIGREPEAPAAAGTSFAATTSRPQRRVQGIAGGAVSLKHYAQRGGLHTVYVTYSAAGVSALRAWVGPLDAPPRDAEAQGDLPATTQQEQDAALCSFRLRLAQGDNEICIGCHRAQAALLSSTHPSTELLRIVVALDESELPRDTAAVRCPELLARHEQTLTALALLHQRQLDLLGALDGLYTELLPCAALRGREEPRDDLVTKIDSQKQNVLTLACRLQQARLQQRQYFYDFIRGLAQVGLSAQEDSASRRAQRATDRMSLLGVVSSIRIGGMDAACDPGLPPFPAIATAPPRRAAHALPNLLCNIQPQIRVLREVLQQQLLRDVGQVPDPLLLRAMSRDLFSRLVQNMDLMHREQLLLLGEGIQEMTEALLGHMRSGSAPRLHRAAPECVGGPERSDVLDLDHLQKEWERQAALASARVDRRRWAEQQRRTPAPQRREVAVQVDDAAVAADVAVSDIADGEELNTLVDACRELLQGGSSAAGALPGAAGVALRDGRRRVCFEVLQEVASGTRVHAGPLLEVLLCAVMDGVTAYTAMVLSASQHGQAVSAERLAAEVSQGPPEDTAQLETHLRALSLLRDLHRLAERTPPEHGAARLRLLAGTVRALRRLQQARADGAQLGHALHEEALLFLRTVAAPPKDAPSVTVADTVAATAVLDRYLQTPSRFAAPAQPGRQPPAARRVRWWLSASGRRALRPAEPGAAGAPREAAGQPLLEAFLCGAPFRRLRVAAMHEEDDEPGQGADPEGGGQDVPRTTAAVRARAVAISKRRWTVDLLCFGILQQLLGPSAGPVWGQSKYEAARREEDDTVRVRAAAPFYQGTFEVGQGGSTYKFAVNGQTGDVYFSSDAPAPPACLGWAVARVLLRQRCVWVLLNAALLASRARVFFAPGEAA